VVGLYISYNAGDRTKYFVSLNKPEILRDLQPGNSVVKFMRKIDPRYYIMCARDSPVTP
jgi:hypothetical protein